MVHGAMRRYVNCFQPSFKLVAKTRNGSAVIKRYSPPATPCDRVMRHGADSAEAKAILAKRRATLDPMALALLHVIREAQSALASIVSPELRPTPRGESLERFWARLPDQWREEQEQAGGEPRARAPHTRRQQEPANIVEAGHPDQYVSVHFQLLSRWGNITPIIGISHHGVCPLIGHCRRP